MEEQPKGKRNALSSRESAFTGQRMFSDTVCFSGWPSSSGH